MLVLCLLFLAAPVRAGDWHPLDGVAPGEDELRSALDALEETLVRAEAVHEALGLLQNALAADEYDPLRCDDPAVASLVARSRVFGAAHRDAAQAARVRLERLTRVMASQTVAELLPGPLGAKGAALQGRAELQVRRQREAASWQWHYLEQRRGIERCGQHVGEAPGFPSPVPGRAADAPVAIWAEGRLCPSEDLARGVVIVSGRVCVDMQCDCRPAVVLPGAALAP